MSLLDETIELLNEHKKSIYDVVWVGNSSQYMTWQDFAEIACRDYDTGFGAVEVCLDLKVVGKDFWLERHEYDGSEWWEYKVLPKMPGEEAQFSISIQRIVWADCDGYTPNYITETI